MKKSTETHRMQSEMTVKRHKLTTEGSITTGLCSSIIARSNKELIDLTITIETVSIKNPQATSRCSIQILKSSNRLNNRKVHSILKVMTTSMIYFEFLIDT